MFPSLAVWLSSLVFQWTLCLAVAPGSSSGSRSRSHESDDLRTAESVRTNSHGGPVTGSQAILDLYHRVSDKETEDQEILLNLIEKSKDRTSVRNYVTVKPRTTKKTTKRPLTNKKSSFLSKKSKRKFKPSIPDDELARRRRKRKKLIDKIKEKRKPSHMQVPDLGNMTFIF